MFATAAFNEEGTDESNLQGGIIKKLMEAAKATGEEEMLIPSRGAKPSAGKEWRTLVTEAQLTPLETNAFTIKATCDFKKGQEVTSYPQLACIAIGWYICLPLITM